VASQRRNILAMLSFSAIKSAISAAVAYWRPSAVAGLEFAVGTNRVSQKLPRLFVPTSQKPFRDVEHHGQRRGIHLVRDFTICEKRPAFEKGSELVGLALRRLPDAQIFKTEYTHAAVCEHVECQGLRTKD